MIHKITFMKKCILAISFLFFTGLTFSQDPSSPTGLVITDGTSGQFTLTWNADANATGGYNIFIVEGSSGDVYVTTIAAGSTSYTYSGTIGSITITDGNTYTAKIQALPDGDSTAYAETSKTINPPQDPNAPTGLEAKSNGSNKFRLTWVDDPNATGGHNIFIVEGGSGDQYITTVPAGTTSFDYKGTYGSVTVADGGTFIAKIQALPDGNFNAYADISITLNPIRTISDGDWNTAGTWFGGIIPGIADKPFINHNVTAASAINVDEIIVEEGKSISTTADITVATDMTLLSSSSFKTTAAFTGNVEYRRKVTANADNEKGWHLIAAPVNGQSFSKTWADNNSLATSGTKRGFAPYNNGISSNNWSYYTDANTDALANGLGYSIKRSTAGEIIYKGTLNNANVTPNVTIGAGTAFNLLGNPFAGYYNSGALLINNSTNLESDIWVWDSAMEMYSVKPSGMNFKVAPGQGFFVKAKNNMVPVTFDTDDISVNETNTFAKGISKPEIDLLVTDGNLNRYAKIMFTNKATAGYDAGYDGETFGGIPSSFDLFSQLLEDNNSKKYQIQALPNSDLEDMIIPIGIIADANKEIVFSAKSLNLPSYLKVFLEDKETNTIVELNETDKIYKVTLTSKVNGIGRFYLHAKSSALNVDTNSIESVKIFTANNSLNIVGLPQGTANVKLFNILGKQIMQTSVTELTAKNIILPNLSTGIYIVQLETDAGKLNKKITLK